MRAATAFAASDVTSEFVVWTMPSPFQIGIGCLPSSLYTCLRRGFGRQAFSIFSNEKKQACLQSEALAEDWLGIIIPFAERLRRIWQVFHCTLLRDEPIMSLASYYCSTPLWLNILQTPLIRNADEMWRGKSGKIPTYY